MFNHRKEVHMKGNSGRLCRYCISIAFIGITFLGALIGPAAQAAAFNGNVNTLLLLLPDGQSASDPNVTVWMNAAAEEGLHMTTVTDSQFMQMGTAALTYAGLIMPDQVHIRATDNLIVAVRNFVTQGGTLMLVYDAGVLTAEGFYAIPKSRLSTLAGVDYALYDQLRDHTIGLGHVIGLPGLMQSLNVPPGKSMPYPQPGTSLLRAAAASAAVPAPQQFACYLPALPRDPGGLKENFRAKRSAQGRHRGHGGTGGKPDLAPDDVSQLPLECVRGPGVRRGQYELRNIQSRKIVRAQERGQGRGLGLAKENEGVQSILQTPTPGATPSNTAASPYGITGYVYGFLTYPSFVTQGAFAGEALLTSPNYGLVAGVNQVGQGRVLFVNSPLGYLKATGTDGLLLHGFLRYFAGEMLELPYLSGLPNGRAGMVLNWHLDAQDALAPIVQLNALGVWNHGPFSMHMTAGPDVVTHGDGLGFNLPSNPATQAWLRTFVAQGHQVGSHGGWIHDFFGDNASETNEASFKPYLDLNEQAIRSVTGRPSTEYSAPQGNTPKWSVDWMQQQGVLAYYWTGNSGMAPTEAYREGQIFHRNIWAVPLSTYGSIATFEEFEETNVPAAEATAWLENLTDFVVQNRTARMIYMHPPGAIDYPQSLMALLARASQHKAANRFTWYTMTDLARFLNERKKTAWQVATLSNGDLRITASHVSSLARHTWAFPKTGYSRPVLTAGSTANGTVRDDGQGEWLVTANSGKSLTFTTRRLQ